MKVGDSLGQFGKTMAAKYLHREGYHIVEMNFRKNYTVIDIIATKDKTLVFFEVKTRISEDFSKPFDTVTKERMKNLSQLASVYFHLHPHLPKVMRLDAVGVTLDKYRNVLDVEHIQNIYPL